VRNRLKFGIFASLTTVAALAIIMACTDKSARAKPNYVYKSAPSAGIVAKIGGVTITEEELIGDDKLEFYEVRKREYELKMKRLKALLVKKLIGKEAEKAKMSLDDFIDKKIASGSGKISDSEFNKFVKTKKIPKDQITDQLKDRIRTYMKEQKRDKLIEAHIAKLTKRAPVEVYFKKPRLKIDVNIADSASWGSKDSKVKIIEFSDFQCPFCARAAETVSLLKRKYGNKVEFAFKHFPLPMHREARPASEASLCINEQSTSKFWKFHDVIFKNQNKLDDASLEKYAKQVGANIKKYNECYKAKKFAGAVQKDIAAGEKIGVRSTPTFFINGQILSGAVPIDQFEEIIDEELQMAKGT